jgi:hypothetical protein
VLVWLVPQQAHAQSGTNINPRHDCVWVNPNGSWISVWRYKNAQGAITIPVGTGTPDNYFTGVGTPAVAQNQGQFTSFLASQTPQSTVSFTVTMPATVTSLTWNLSGNGVSATPSGGSTCASQPVPLIAGFSVWSEALVLVTAMSGTAILLRRKKARTPTQATGQSTAQATTRRRTTRIARVKETL